MIYKPYEEYKNTKIKGIGEIPKHWQLIKLKHFASIVMGQSPDSRHYNDKKEGLPFLQGCKTFGEINPTFDVYTTDFPKIAKKNSILMSVRAPVGDLNIAAENICIGRGLCSINNINGSNKFLYYLLKSNSINLNYYSNGSTFDSINKEDIGNLITALPNINEQNDIADFLDKELSGIDNTIVQLKENIKLLEEYKTSLIYHAVNGKIDVRRNVNE